MSKLCELCNKTTGGENKSSLRGLTLCYECDAGLAKGKFSAVGIASEIKSMKLGTMVIDRAPLPASVRYYFEPFPVGHHASQAATPAEPAPVEPAAPLPAPVPPVEPQPVCVPQSEIDTVMETTPQFAIARKSRKPSASGKPSKPRGPRRRKLPQPPPDHADKMRRLIAAIHV